MTPRCHSSCQLHSWLMGVLNCTRQNHGMAGNCEDGCFVNSTVTTLFTKLPASRFPTLPGIIPVGQKNVHWLWMGDAGRNSFQRPFWTAAGNPATVNRAVNSKGLPTASESKCERKNFLWCLPLIFLISSDCSLIFFAFAFAFARCEQVLNLLT